MSLRLLLGLWPAGVGSGAGLRVAQPGKSAASADDRDLTLSSDWAAILPEHAVIAPFTVARNTIVSQSYPDLGYTPFAFVLWQPVSNPSLSPFMDGWQSYDTMPYLGRGQTGLYLTVRFYRDHMIANFNEPDAYTQFGDYPTSVQVTAIVYRLRAGP